ncbi:efflux RND transporter periplasmic adaptor subunit [Pseudomarimonas salicorniae]|uniref:Efflux RND transporter periplasmic adaptor subunit n=1 Tax=Pseudomarimonas salicorniae TaxID=2933270 RepID=A0ABT0GEA2_9GAMM|nr:efflux RND transporter periplasmic adaptor subunit [Lysobacter sp. CAU 1642]MCK7592682.1 efflux RND transporter periplasmic adaptor subunit [Lysobacter sp. CAU 1642]
MNKRWLVFGAIALLIALPVFLKSRTSDAKAVDVQAVSPREVKASILASGNLVFREQALLSPEVIGKVRAVLVEEGDKVEAGQVVLRLDEQVYQAEVAQQEAFVRQQRINIERQRLNVANAERQWKRVHELNERGLLDDNQADSSRHAFDVAKVELQASREALKQAEASLQQARERLARTEIRAPIAGTVMAVDIKVGETAVSSATGIAGSSLMTIANPDSLMTEVNVDEADIARIAVGQPVDVFAAAFPDTALPGEVESIPLSPRSQGVGQQTSLARNYAVKVRLADPKALALRPGMTCRAEIYTANAENVVAVPVQAVFSTNQASTEVKPGTEAPEVEHYLFVEKDGKVERRVVEVGLSDDSWQEVRAGLSDGERVVTGPYKVLRHLKDGEAVEARAPREGASDESVESGEAA